MVRYNRRATSLLYNAGSDKGVDESLALSFKVDSIGKATGLQPEKPLSCKMSKAYLRWHKDMPLADLATSIPKKIFQFPQIFYCERVM